jgi:hypothetical protein
MEHEWREFKNDRMLDSLYLKFLGLAIEGMISGYGTI